MKVIVEGHKYEIDNYEGHGTQIISFVHKQPVDNVELGLVEDGVTNEQVLEVLIHRLQYLNQKMPCRENALAITNLEQSLMWLEKRKKDRKKRGVEGKYLG